MERYYHSFEHYPEKLAKIIEGNPLRRRWETDPWGRPFYYKTNKLRDSYVLSSFGPDGVQGTSDDYVFKKFDN